MAGHISVECDDAARRVVESYFPDSLFHDDVTTVDLQLVKQWSLKFQNVGLIILGAGPPCQGVSGLNSSRRGALRDHRSCLFQEVPRITGLFRVAFPWAQVRFLGESVASMDDADRKVMSEAFNDLPWRCDCYGLTLCHRPRYFWIDWELAPTEGVLIQPTPDGGEKGVISFDMLAEASHLLLPGWEGPPNGLPTFTTRSEAGRSSRLLST